MQVTFCGVRGSTPSPGPGYLRYGGETSCVALSADGGSPTLVLDGGTGLRRLTDLLGGEAFRGTVLLGHLHWDHVQGLPFFKAGWLPGARVHVQVPRQGDDPENVLAGVMSPPYFPVRPAQLGEGWSFSFTETSPTTVEGFRVLALDIPHKGGRTLGFRVERDGASLAYLSDHSPTSLGPGTDGLGALHDTALRLADGVDVLIHDAQHLARDFPGVGYLGHAAAEYAVRLAEEAGATRVALFHHDPWRDDDAVDATVTRLRAETDVEVIGAAEGVTLELAASAPTETSGLSH